MNTEFSVNLNFIDMFSGESLNADVLYDLSVINPNGTDTIERKGLVAMNAQDTQIIVFPIAGDYKMLITINGLQTASGQKQDDVPL